ncbi:TonB-dependent receptor [Flavobacteriaceae bacterium]|nr:TonB-dependent receptor [Flavobacteriaceae bacterium]
MKKLLCTVALSLMLVNLNAQEKIQDTIKTQILDEVLVKSIRVDTDSPITHSNLDKEELAKTNLGQDIPVLLNYLPSVVTTSDAGAGIGYTYIRVRGSDASRVNITINGIPYNDSESQGTFWVNMPDFASSIENLQLQRGVGTSTNGSGSFGASLNILSDGVSDNAFSEIGIAGGSFNSQKYNVKFSTGLLNDHFEVSGRLSKITSDGYIDRASSDLKSYFLQGAFINDNTLIKALVFGGKEKTYQAWYGIDAETLENDRTYNPAGIYTDDDGNVKFYDNETDNYSQDHYQLFWNQKINNNWTTNLGLNYTYGRGYYEQYKEDEDFVFYNLEPIELGGEVINTTDLIRRRWLDNDFYVINANANYKKDNLEVYTGIFYSHYDGDHYGEVIWAKYASNSEIRDRYYEGNGKKNEFTVFAKATYKFKEKWSIYGDLQGRFLTYKTSGLTSDRVPLEVNEKYNFFNPKTGLTYELSNKNQLYVSYGRAHREPRRADFENGITKPEKLDDYELGWRFKAQKNTINTNIYFMNYKDQLVLTGAIDDTGAPLRATSGKSYRLGLEIDATFLIGDNFRILPNLALSSNKNLDFVSPIDGELVNLGTTNLSFSPNIVAGNKFEYEPITNLLLGLYTKYVGQQYMGNVDSDVSKLDAYFVNDFNVSYTIDNIPFLREIVVTGLVNNIFNIKYVSNGYYYTYDDTWTDPTTTTTIEGTGYYPQATINFLVGAAVKF